MKNNTVGKIAVATAERALTLKNKSSDLHTTMDFGSVMCAKLQRCIPGTKISVGTKERVLLTSLVAPTMGRMSLKAYHRFVPFSELTRNYGPMMAQQQVHRADNAFVPQNLPYCRLKDLSLFVLFGSQLTVYEYGTNFLDLRQIPSSVKWDDPLSSLPSACQQAINLLGLSATLGYNTQTVSYSIRAKGILDGQWSTGAYLFFANQTPASFFDYSTQHPNEKGFLKSFVTPEGADYLIPVKITDSNAVDHYYLLAFRLSSFGRRLRKNLIGCGWQFNIDTDVNFSLMPLMAYYKAYFDTFGLTLYDNWEESFCYSLIQRFDVMAQPTVDPWLASSGSPISGVFRNFIFEEFGMTYFTDEQDFVSAHTRNTAVAAIPSGLVSSIVTDVTKSAYPSGTGNPAINVSAYMQNEPTGLTVPNGHAFVNDVVHGHLDSKLLMRLYQQTNAQTIAGRRIAELLRLQGYGKYVEEHQSNFIGSWSLDLNVYDLPSQSDTYQNAHDGMRLGEMGAFGKSSGQHPMVSYHTEEDGYFITLMVVVPKGGYAETVDPDALCLLKYDQYSSKYDSLGYEYNRKMTTVQGSQPWANMALNDGSLGDSFGLAPRDFKRKFGRNVVNGDMSLRSTRHTYQPFNLEKLIQVGEHKVEAVDTSISGLDRYPWESVNYLSPSATPIAGNVWRYPTRYEWISQFNRIFYNDQSSVDAYQEFDVGYDGAGAFEFFSLRDDNFIVHVIFEMQVWDQMLPVQDSFETDDEEKRSNTSISKA